MNHRIISPLKTNVNEYEILVFEVFPPQSKKIPYHEQVPDQSGLEYSDFNQCNVSSEYLHFEGLTDWHGAGDIRTSFTLTKLIYGSLTNLDINTHIYTMHGRLENEFLTLLQFYKLDKFFSADEFAPTDAKAPSVGLTYFPNKFATYKYESKQYPTLTLRSSFTECCSDHMTTLRIDLAVNYQFHYPNYLVWSYSDTSGREVVYPHSWHEL
jgi:hypothetical protein